MDKPSSYYCACEHRAHFDPSARTPAGNPGHEYGIPFLKAIKVTTHYGTFPVCPDCAADCQRSNPQEA